MSFEVHHIVESQVKIIVSFITISPSSAIHSFETLPRRQPFEGQLTD